MILLRSLITRVIRLYRKYLSPMKLQCCRFYPSCSEYAIEAIERRGLLYGSFMAALRILRCQPFSKGGYDPVR